MSDAAPGSLAEFRAFREQMNASLLGAGNLTINRFFALPFASVLIPDHPLAKTWLDVAADYVRYKGEAGAKEAGRMRLEGKDYIVHDGDVMHFRFNV